MEREFVTQTVQSQNLLRCIWVYITVDIYLAYQKR